MISLESNVAPVTGGTSDVDSVQPAYHVSCTDTLGQLQSMAAAFSRPLPPAQSLIAVQVVFVAGAASPWRLVETVRSITGQRRHMLCFDSQHRIRLFIEERLAWQRGDEQFVERHMTPPRGFDITADWVHRKDFDLIFGPQRDALCKQMCTTSPDHVVTLC
jgi:hypothetical protein